MNVRFSTFSVFLIGGFGKALERFESQLFLEGVEWIGEFGNGRFVTG